MRDDELDAMLSAITSVQPDPRLASRVLRTIEAPRVSRVGSSSRTVRAVAALGAAAVLVLAIGAAWRASGPVASPPAPAAPGGMWDSTSALHDDAMRGRALALQDHAAWGGASVLPAARRSAAAVSEDDPWPTRLPALERSAPIAIDAIDPEAIAQEEIGVRPLSIAQLEIASLER
jgi:hypothetical protein